MGQVSFVFVKYEQLPTESKVDSLEWRTLDLLNNFHHSHTSKEDEMYDLRTAIDNKILDLVVLRDLATRFGNHRAWEVLKAVSE